MAIPDSMPPSPQVTIPTAQGEAVPMVKQVISGGGNPIIYPKWKVNQ